MVIGKASLLSQSAITGIIYYVSEFIIIVEN